MRCVGCNREMKDGDLCIRDTVSGFTGLPPNDAVDGLMAAVFGGADEVILCLDCTEKGGQYTVQVYHEEVQP
jgi:hypothetical protein